MIKYAKLTNETTGECQVGNGTNIDFYQSIGMVEMDVQQSDIDGYWYLTEKCPMKTDEEKELEEKARIQELFMTRSDFFDGTIDAWGIGEDELLLVIKQVLALLPFEDKMKLKALNNFKNALNFYRKHTLFSLLVGNPIKLTDTIQVTLTDEALDKYFDEVAKGNKDTAWQYLPQPVAIPIEPEESVETPMEDIEPIEDEIDG